MNKPTSPLTPLEMFYHWEANTPLKTYLRQPHDSQWQDYSWKQVGIESRKVARALNSLGINDGERVCILSKNCAHWVMADLAIMMSGGASAPAFTTMTAEDVLFIVQHSNSQVIFVGQTDNWAEVKAVLPPHIKVIALPGANIEGADFQWQELTTDYIPLAGNPYRAETDELTTIYTSGSTGQPKGVMYSFSGAGHVANNLHETFKMTEQDRCLSYLPMAHGFERALLGWMSMKSGFTIGFNDRQDTFSDDMQFIKPTLFQSVPRLWTKFQESILSIFGGQDSLKILLDDPERSDLTKTKIQTALGLHEGRLFLTGSAPTPMPLHQWYESLDMPLCEIYGQSEVLSGSSNLPWDRKPGTLGKPTCNTKLKISDEGEILIKADAMMTGYLHEEEKTNNTMVDGWIHTGDKGTIDNDGFLSITGRVKEIFKTAKGKYVAPAPIEGLFVSNTDIEQVCLMGNGMANTFLIVLLTPWAKDNDKTETSNKLQDQIEKTNRLLDAHERIAGALIVKDSWSSENGYLTHTLKIKRSAIEKAYQQSAEEAFDNGASTSNPLILWQ